MAKTKKQRRKSYEMQCKYVEIKKWDRGSGEKVDYFCRRFPEKLLVTAEHFCGEHKK